MPPVGRCAARRATTPPLTKAEGTYVSLPVTEPKKPHNVAIENPGKEEMRDILDQLKRGKSMEQRNMDMERDMASQMYKEMFKLYLLEGEQQQRLDIVKEKESDYAFEMRKTTIRAEQVEAQMKEMETSEEHAAEVRHEQIVQLEESVESLEGRIAELDEEHAVGKDYITEQLKLWKDSVMSLEREILHMELTNRGETIPPGPFEFKWVSKPWWHLCSWGVLILNLLVLLLAFLHKDVNFDYFEDFFLLFYSFELGCNLVYYRLTFFTSGCGVLDMMVVLGSAARRVMMLLRWEVGFLWLLRCLCVLRMPGVSRHVYRGYMVDLSWIERDFFQTSMLGVITLNCFFMGMETENESLFLWTFVDSIFLVIFLCELCLRLFYYGMAFFWDHPWMELVWNYLDGITVVIAMLCLWIEPLSRELQHMAGNKHVITFEPKQLFAALRVCRLSRFLRLADLVRGVPPLYLLVTGISRALQGIGWVMLLTACILYICALIGVKLIGEGWVLPANEDDLEEVKKTFPNVLDAIFNLFEAMNGDLSRVDPLLKHVKNSHWVMMGFIILTNWAIFSILTAVVGDNMALVTQEHEEKIREAEEAREKTERYERMDRIFQRIDVDGNGSVDFGEFCNLLNDETSAKELSISTGLPMGDLVNLFDLISKRHGYEKTETISHDEFMKLLNTECGQVTARSMMRMEKECGIIEHLLEKLGLEPATNASGIEDLMSMDKVKSSKSDVA